MLAYHRELLADSTRTLAFREALRQVIKPEDVVLDLGSGSGVLAFFAAEAGARKVYAIERGHMADVIALMSRHLAFSDRIEVVHEKSREVELPERATVLVAEIIGSFGLEEQILSHVIDARTRLLREGATIIPSGFSLAIGPVELPRVHAKHIQWWSEPRYGFDFSPLRTFASNVLVTTDIGSDAYIAPPASLAEIDLYSVHDTNVTGQASFEARRESVLHGFGGTFDATLAADVMLTNREPRATCWQQVFLPLETPVALSRGARIDVEVQSQDGTSWRWRGRAAGTDFDQTTWLSSPPCIRTRHQE